MGHFGSDITKFYEEKTSLINKILNFFKLKITTKIKNDGIGPCHL